MTSVIRDLWPTPVTSAPADVRRYDLLTAPESVTDRAFLPHLAAISLLLAVLRYPRPADAETLLLRDETWQIFTDGRVGAFASWALGDGLPQPSKYPSLEGELVFEHRFGSRSRVLLFANALVQKVYRDGYCPPESPASPSPCDGTLAGVGYGGRLEIGRVHLAFAGHRSVGIEPDYLPEVVDAEVDQLGNLRTLDGHSVRGEVVLGRFDVFGGASIARVFPTASDNQRMQAPIDTTSQNEIDLYSLIKNQAGIDVGVVYSLNGGLYFDLEYSRIQAAWYLGEKQVVHVLNCGMGLGW